MSVATNPDRAYVPREYRASVRMSPDDLLSSHIAFQDAGIPNLGAALLNISPGGCCLRFMGFDLPGDLAPGTLISSLKLLHPALDRRPIRGRVAWRAEAHPHTLIGVQFLEVSTETRTSIETFLEATRSREEVGSSQT